MELTELLKKYNAIKCSYQIGTLSPAIIPLFETVTAVIGSGDLFPVLKAHYVDGKTMETIAEESQPQVEPRTVYRRQKAELQELESIINGHWLRIIPPPYNL